MNGAGASIELWNSHLSRRHSGCGAELSYKAGIDSLTQNPIDIWPPPVHSAVTLCLAQSMNTD